MMTSYYRTLTPDSGLELSPIRSPDKRKKYTLTVEDDCISSEDPAGLWREPCPICSHVFHSNSDYIAHGRIHFMEKQQQDLYAYYSGTPYYPGLYPGPDVFWQPYSTIKPEAPKSIVKTKPPQEDQLRKTKKRKKKTTVEKEDLDADTLKRLAKFEWEKKHGHWCRVCSIRFPSQEKLVDHLSYDDSHALKSSNSKENVTTK